LSSIILVMRTLTIIGLIIYAAGMRKPVTLSNHVIINLSSLVWHLTVIILAKKLPKFMIYLHGPLVMLTFFFSIGQSLAKSSSSTGTPTVLNMTFFLISGLLLNSSWMLTSFCILANSISTLYFLLMKT